MRKISITKRLLSMGMVIIMAAGLIGCDKKASDSQEDISLDVSSDGQTVSQNASTEYFGDESTEDGGKVTDSASSGTEITGKFPDFTGKDLDGNDVSSDIFGEKAVTLVNFWFNTCSPCIDELPKLNELNESLKEKGGAVIGINVETMDGYVDGINQAKEILQKQGASYQNIYFDSDSDAGKYASEIMAFPTTILVDRNGNIVGEPILGGIDNDEVMQEVQDRIDAIIANDAKTE